jgi:hypothetical protein
MPLILDDKQPIILVPDNSPITALSAIGNLNIDSRTRTATLGGLSKSRPIS